MLRALLGLFLGCKHRLSFPVTDPKTHHTYQVCLRCGREYPYDWEKMTRLRRGPQKPEVSVDRDANRTAVP